MSFKVLNTTWISLKLTKKVLMKRMKLEDMQVLPSLGQEKILSRRSNQR